MQDQTLSSENLSLLDLPTDIWFIILEKMDLVDAVKTVNALLLINSAFYNNFQPNLMIEKAKKKVYLSVQEAITNFIFRLPALNNKGELNQDESNILFNLMSPLINYFNSLKSSHTGNKLVKGAVQDIIRDLQPKFIQFLIAISNIRLTQDEKKLKKSRQNAIKLFKKYYPEKIQDLEAQNISFKSWIPHILAVPEDLLIEERFPFGSHQWKKLLMPLMDTTKRTEQPAETFLKFIENLFSLPLETYLCHPEKTWYLANQINHAWIKTIGIQNAGDFLFTLLLHKKATEDNANSVIGRLFKKYDHNILSKRYGLTKVLKALSMFICVYAMMHLLLSVFAGPDQIVPALSILLCGVISYGGFSLLENNIVVSYELAPLINILKPIEEVLPDVEPCKTIPSTPKTGYFLSFFKRPNSIQSSNVNNNHELESDDLSSDRDSSQEEGDIYHFEF